MIEIRNLTRTAVGKSFLKKNIKKILNSEGVKGEIELSIVLAGRFLMKGLNKKYRGENDVTDVLSFASPRRFSDKINDLGELVICLERVRKNAEKSRISFKKELANCLIHGLLHLLGYDHEKKRTTKTMEEKQRYYLSRAFK